MGHLDLPIGFPNPPIKRPHYIGCPTVSKAQARPIVLWADREVQTVNQDDILANYLRDYFLLVGGTSPVPDLIHHQAGGSRWPWGIACLLH